MKKKISIVLLLSLAMSGVISSNNKVVDAAIESAPSQSYSSSLSSTYYSSVSGLTGDALLEGLAKLTKTNHKYYTTYDDLKGACYYSDRDTSKSGYFIDFYSGWSVPADWNSKVWNREHVWCQNNSGGLFGESGAGSDIHHIRPLIMNINSSRSDNKFTDSENKGSASMSSHTFNGTQSVLSAYKGKTTGNKVGGGYWEPRDAVKGDIARILMYLYTHYSKEVSANSSFTYAGNLSITNIAYSSKGGASAVWDMLVDWHNNDPVDSFEKK